MLIACGPVTGTEDAQAQDAADVVALERNLRCGDEYTAMTGMSPASATVVCTTSSEAPTCRACRGSGPAEQCPCWASGESSGRTCVR